MGLLRESVALYAARLSSLLLSIAASLILARRLPAVDYGAYQFASKRLHVYLSAPVLVAGYWAYRYIAMGVQGALTAYLLVLAATAAAALAAGTLIVSSTFHELAAGAALLLAGCASAAMAAQGLQTVLPSLDAIRASQAAVVRSLVFAAAVLLLWRLGLLTLGAVAAACIASAAAGLVVALWGVGLRGVCRKCIWEWLRGAWIPLLAWLANSIASLDALIVLLLAGEDSVAAFFALSLIPRFSLDLVVWSQSRVQAYLLSTMDYATVTETMRLVYTLHAFIAAYAAANPEQVAAFAGARYTVYAYALPIIAASYLARPLGYLAAQVMMGSDRSRAGESGRLLRLHPLIALAAAAVQTSLLAAMLAAGLDPLVAWGASLLASSTLNLALRLAVMPPRAARLLALRLAAPTAAYAAIAYLYARLLATPTHSPVFTENLALTIRSAAPPLAAYAATILALDPEARLAAKKLASLALSTLRRANPRYKTSRGSSWRHGR